jgi:hypothetical protein
MSLHPAFSAVRTGIDGIKYPGLGVEIQSLDAENSRHASGRPKSWLWQEP